MSVVRVVLAVVLAAALGSASLPAAERVECDRNAAAATAKLQRVAAAADRLAAENDPARPGDRPATTTVDTSVPGPRLTDGGRLHLADDRLAWTPASGPNQTVSGRTPIRVPDAPVPSPPGRDSVSPTCATTARPWAASNATAERRDGSSPSTGPRPRVQGEAGG